MKIVHEIEGSFETLAIGQGAFKIELSAVTETEAVILEGRTVDVIALLNEMLVTAELELSVQKVAAKNHRAILKHLERR